MLSDDLRDLYQQVILDHSRNPRNSGELSPPCLHAHGDNPSCGDEIDVWVRVADNGYIDDLKFTGQGCAISQASASMMTQKIMHKPRAEAEALWSSLQCSSSSWSPAPASRAARNRRRR